MILRTAIDRQDKGDGLSSFLVDFSGSEHNRWEMLDATALALSAAYFGIYAATTAPTIVGGDSGELVRK